MAVAVKNAPETSTRSVFRRLAVASFVGMLYVLVSIAESDFRVTVVGFDENRDLFVDVHATEAIDDSQT